MIKLHKPVTIARMTQDPATKTIKQDGTITLDYIDVLYHDYPTAQQYFCNIQGVPGIVMLFEGSEYSKHQNITVEMGKNKLLTLMGNDQQTWLNNRMPKLKKPKLEDDPYGPGTILHNMLKKIGIKSTENCSCISHAIVMNQNGSEWCENNIETILSWLETESKKRKIPFIKKIAKLIVQRAINKSKKYEEQRV